MKIKHLSLQHFRNYETLSLDFNDGLTILTGENAQGKTNLLEAIFLLSLGKSHRTSQDREMIQWGEEYSKIEGTISTNHFEFPLALEINKKGKKAYYNHIEQAKLSQFIGKLNVILFAPEDLQIIKGSPSIRRKFIDSELGQVNPIYLQELLEYQRLLKQRNRYLKEQGYSYAFDSVYFEVLTEQLVDRAVKIVQSRLLFKKTIEKLAQTIHLSLSNQKDYLTLDYESSSAKLNYSECKTLKEQFMEAFHSIIQQERDRGLTLIGPHRDDLIFYLNEKRASDYGSQGQQRTIVLSLKLAEIEWMYEMTGEYPVLLLDDVLSELDDARQHILMEQIEGKVQTFLTTATIQGLDLSRLNRADIYHIESGIVQNGNKGE